MNNWKIYGYGTNFFSSKNDIEIVDVKGFEIATISTTAISPAWLRSNPSKHWGDSKSSHIERTEKEVEKIGHLIAAAPKLLKACKNAIRYVPHPGPRRILLEAIAEAKPDTERK